MLNCNPCVFPVASAEALAWARGRLDDIHLVMESPLKPEAVFILNLPAIAGWRDSVEYILSLRKDGACFIIARTSNPIVHRHLMKAGGVVTFKEFWPGEVRSRIIVPPEQFHRYFSRLAKS
jgi:hypothetical protein